MYEIFWTRPSHITLHFIFGSISKWFLYSWAITFMDQFKRESIWVSSGMTWLNMHITCKFWMKNKYSGIMKEISWKYFSYSNYLILVSCYFFLQHSFKTVVYILRHIKECKPITFQFIQYWTQLSNLYYFNNLSCL